MKLRDMLVRSRGSATTVLLAWAATKPLIILEVHSFSSVGEQYFEEWVRGSVRIMLLTSDVANVQCDPLPIDPMV